LLGDEGPLLAGWKPRSTQTAQLGLPFILSGVLKSAYDITLWFMFRAVPLKEESARGAAVKQT